MALCLFYSTAFLVANALSEYMHSELARLMVPSRPWLILCDVNCIR